MAGKTIRNTSIWRLQPFGVFMLAFVLVVTPDGVGTCAEPKSENSPAAKSPSAQPVPKKVEKPAPIAVPPPRNLLIMIRTTLVALYQANLTNNYSVLRDLGAPSFQHANSAERLSAAFANLRSRGGDMAPVVLALPTLTKPPIIDQNGMLRLTGVFDTKPNEIAFDLAFQAVDGFWRLDGIGVQFRAPVAANGDETSASKKAPAEASKSNAKAKSKKAAKSPKPDAK
jgi:hypothetical protein